MISIVIPLYNKAHTITETLKSIFDQTFQEFEIIIVDDGSTDNGVNIIEELTNDSRIKIIQQSNQGVSSARNRGVKESKYEYIAFLDGDDQWLPEYLTKMHQAIKSFPECGMFCCAGYVRDKGGEHLRLAQKYKNKIQKIDFFENPGVFLHTSATIVSKSAFNNTNGFPIGMKRNQDFALFFTLALQVPVAYCGFPLSVYIGGVEGQATSTPSIQVISHIIDRYNHVFRNYLNLNRSNPSFIVFYKYELRHYIITMLRSNDYISLKTLFDSIDVRIKNIFSSFELFLYSKKSLRNLAILEIYITKIRWRLRGYPRVK